MASKEGSVYANLTPTWRDRELVFDRPSAQDKVEKKKRKKEEGERKTRETKDDKENEKKR